MLVAQGKPFKLIGTADSSTTKEALLGAMTFGLRVLCANAVTVCQWF